MPTAAEEIRDELIENDVRYQRAAGHVRRLVDKRLEQLGREIKETILRIDAHGAQRNDARQRRLKKLEEEIKVLVRTAYSEVNGILKSELRKTAKVETMATAKAIRRHVP